MIQAYRINQKVHSSKIDVHSSEIDAEKPHYKAFFQYIGLLRARNCCLKEAVRMAHAPISMIVTPEQLQRYKLRKFRGCIPAEYEELLATQVVREFVADLKDGALTSPAAMRWSYEPYYTKENQSVFQMFLPRTQFKKYQGVVKVAVPEHLRERVGMCYWEFSSSDEWRNKRGVKLLGTLLNINYLTEQIEVYEVVESDRELRPRTADEKWLSDYVEIITTEPDLDRLLHFKREKYIKVDVDMPFLTLGQRAYLRELATKTGLYRDAVVQLAEYHYQCGPKEFWDPMRHRKECVSLPEREGLPSAVADAIITHVSHEHKEYFEVVDTERHATHPIAFKAGKLPNGFIIPFKLKETVKKRSTAIVPFSQTMKDNDSVDRILIDVPDHNFEKVYPAYVHLTPSTKVSGDFMAEMYFKEKKEMNTKADYHIVD